MIEILEERERENQALRPERVERPLTGSESIYCYSIAKRHHRACVGCNQSRDTRGKSIRMTMRIDCVLPLWDFCEQHTGISIVRLLSSASNCQVNILSERTHKCTCSGIRLVGVHTCRRTVKSFNSRQNCRRCSYFQTPSSCWSGAWRMKSTSDGSRRMDC